MEPGARKENLERDSILAGRTSVALSSAHMYWKSSGEASMVVPSLWETLDVPPLKAFLRVLSGMSLTCM